MCSIPIVAHKAARPPPKYAAPDVIGTFLNRLSVDRIDKAFLGQVT